MPGQQPDAAGFCYPQQGLCGGYFCHRAQLQHHEMVPWNEAWSGAKDQDEEEGLYALNCVMREGVSQGGFVLWLVLSLRTSLFMIPMGSLCCDWFSLSTPQFL